MAMSMSMSMHVGVGQQPPQQWVPGMSATIQFDGVPTKPPPFNPNARAPASGPPPMDGIVQFSGYGQLGFNGGQPLPPPPPPPPSSAPPPPMQFNGAVVLSISDVKQAMLNFASSNMCYGTDCAKEMTITKIAPSSALEYTLETFSEGRSTQLREVPYTGGNVDGPFNGPPPPPWVIPCAPNGMFSDHSKFIDVPHTSTVRACHECQGRGYVRCWHCMGCGNTECHTCNGSGRREVFDEYGNVRIVMCFTCGGDGWNRCTTCGGDGRVTCTHCTGFGQVRNYIQLEVKYTNHKSNFVLESTDLPDHLVSGVPGVNIFEQTLPQVWPIVAFPVPEINAHSQQLVNQHRMGFPGESQLQQRQLLRAVPVTEVNYSWKATNSRFWVYGTQRAVYAPDYPQQCCCVIL